MAEVNRVRMDFPSYPVDIVLPSCNRADTAHDELLNAIFRGAKRCGIENRGACKSLFVACTVDHLVVTGRVVFFGRSEKL